MVYCVLSLLLCALFVGVKGSLDIETDCSVVIVGGTSAALAAALTSAKMGVKTCLIEPTDWLGGQLTISVPAIDFAWHTVTDDNETEYVYKYARDTNNLPPTFNTILGDPGDCWVSTNCYLPEKFLNVLQSQLSQVSENLTVYFNTVVKAVSTVSTCSGHNEIETIKTISRFPSDLDCSGYDLLLSDDLPDWYSTENSDRFTKEIRYFTGDIFIDATEWGELLALSGADYLQGIAEQYDGDTSGIGNDTCGQSSTFGFAEYIHALPVTEPDDPYPVEHADFYSMSGYDWDSIFTYRRLYSSASEPEPGDVTLQNWSEGNDNCFVYTLLSRDDAAAQVSDWMGGVNLDALQTGEYLAVGWHYFFKNQSTEYDPNTITLATEVFGTCTGLTKIPYMRDTRRSIGVDGFIMNVSTISGTVEQVVGYAFPDAVAIGCYDVDVHGIKGCSYPSYMNAYYPVLPYFIPFRALTSQSMENMLVAGKTMAQSFLVNAATRVHPVEWSSGTAAGAAAAFMSANEVYSTYNVVYDSTLMQEVQEAVSEYTPIRWYIEGEYYPPLNEELL